ncbi:hypothetical protein ACIGO6_07690 [Streptomyces sp. NPDC053750]|uniref:hypothetical protein n=1 Tax=Streptomyces sp. NPDC053750 TaxID=3365714 RepID=UPI0037D60D2D
MSDNRAALAAAVASGYLLGRTKKAKLAFVVGSYLAGRRLGLAPGQVLSQGLGRLQQAPQLQELSDQVRGELLTAGRAAVTAAANRRLTGLADTLRDRTDALTGAGRRDDDHDDHDDHGSPEEEAPDEDAYFDEEDRRPAPPRKTAKKAPPHKSPPHKAVPPAKRTAKKTAKKAVPAKRTAGSGHRRGGDRG